jgi:uncharacterized protein YprB with RNaseH-like and TPR domain
MNFDYATAHNDLIEALLHLMDGGNTGYVAKRYRFSESYLKRVMQGRGRQSVREEAFDLYHAGRREQATRDA